MVKSYFPPGPESGLQETQDPTLGDITAALSGTYVRPSDLAPYGFMGARVYPTTTQGVSNGPESNVTLAGVTYDVGGYTGGSSALIIPAGAGGRYRLEQRYTVAGPNTGGSVFFLRKNDTTLLSTPVLMPIANNDSSGYASDVVLLAVGDAISVTSYSNVPDVSLVSGDAKVSITLTKLPPDATTSA